MAQVALAAHLREQKGKGAARKLRKQHQIPAVFYGPNTEPILLAVDYPELERLIKNAASENIILELQLQTDKGSDNRKVILKDLQIDPIKDTYLHADFFEISLDQKITVNVQILLINTPKGVTDGGVLQHVRRELTVSCLPDQLVDSFEVDVSHLEIGDSLHVGEIVLPEGIQSEEEDHLTVAVVAAPTVEPEVEEEEEELEAEAEAEAEAEGKKEEPAEPKADSAEESS
jgi:large subunit ribosomal protein L25